MLLHPPMAHFAIALPVVAAVFGVIYLFNRSEGMSKLSSRMLVVAALAVIAAWYTGSNAGPEIFKYLSAAGKQELLEHKQLGMYLAIAFGIIAVIKFIGCQLKKFALEAVAIVLMLGATAMIFVQGKDGGEIVYEHGQPFKAPMMFNALDKAAETVEFAEDCDEQVEAYEDAIDEMKSISSDVQAVYSETEKEKD